VGVLTSTTGGEGMSFFLMDGRARFDVDDAIVFSCCVSVKEARKEAPDYGDDTCIVDAETMEVVE